MKEIYVNQIDGKDRVQSFFIIKNVDIRVGSNGKQFLDLILGDNTGEVSAKKWDIATEKEELEKLKIGDIVKVRSEVTEWNGSKQLKITRIRLSMPNDNLKIEDYIKAAPEDSQEMFDYIFEQASNIQDKDLRTLCINNLNRNKEKLLYYPAATKNHHAQRGGLLYHIKRMLMNGLTICQTYTELDRDLIVTGVILHDMQKLTEIVSNEWGVAREYSFEGNMLGHLVLGVRELDKELVEMGVDREKAVMLEHMILSHHNQPEFGSPKRPAFPEAVVLHFLDDLDAKMFDMYEALENTKSGSFSDPIWTLDKRKLYKRK